MGLCWGDVDWATNRITVRSAKTEHHEGGASRIIPLFPELLPPLREVFEQAEPGAMRIITRYRPSTQNLRTQFHRIIRKAGLEPWPKLFQNLRSSRETELAERWPLHVVCAWIGNSQAVAAKHYLQVTDDHFDRAATSVVEPVQKVVQNPVQHAHAPTCTAVNAESPNRDDGVENNDTHLGASAFNATETAGLGGTGLEPMTSCV